MTVSNGIFITIEGPDGSGKTTHGRRLVQHCCLKGLDAIYTREPGGTQAGEAIRRILLDPAIGDIVPEAELLLYIAGRAQHVETVIKPALREGKVVLCDRFIDASEAYQGYGRGLPLETVRILNDIASAGVKPRRTIILDMEAGEALRSAIAEAKAEAPGGKGDRMELAGLEFHERVRHGYRMIAERENERVRMIRRREDPEETFSAIIKALSDLLPSIVE